LFLYSQPNNLPKGSDNMLIPMLFSFSPLAIASTKPRHGSTSCPNKLIGYPTVPKHLSSPVIYHTNSPHYMFETICLDSMIVEEVIDYSKNVGNQAPITPRNIPEERRPQHFRYLQMVKRRHLIQ
jgi:hypothetical protein